MANILLKKYKTTKQQNFLYKEKQERKNKQTCG
jgi:hypothetical protein